MKSVGHAVPPVKLVRLRLWAEPSVPVKKLTQSSAQGPPEDVYLIQFRGCSPASYKPQMTKLTPAQAYALQVKADRRAAAAERRGSSVAADEARVKQLYKKAEVKTQADAYRIPVSEAPAEVQAMVAEIAPLWLAQVGFEFPEMLYYGPGDWDIVTESGKATYWVDGRALPSYKGAMARKGGKPCGPELGAKRGQYRFRTPALTTVLARLKKGLPVFA